MVLMNDTIQNEYFEALWGRSGLGLSIARVTLNSADYSLHSFSYRKPFFSIKNNLHIPPDESLQQQIELADDGA